MQGCCCCCWWWWWWRRIVFLKGGDQLFFCQVGYIIARGQSTSTRATNGNTLMAIGEAINRKGDLKELPWMPLVHQRNKSLREGLRLLEEHMNVDMWRRVPIRTC